MKSGKYIGAISLLVLVIAALMGESRVPGADVVAVAFSWTGILGLIYAGIRGSRWWLVIPGALFLLFVWLLNQGH